MLWAAAIGWVLAAVVVFQSGSFDLRFFALGGLFTFAAALSWGVSALIAVGLQSLRSRPKRPWQAGPKQSSMRRNVVRFERGPWNRAAPPLAR
jgi:hypothetical protein